MDTQIRKRTFEEVSSGAYDETKPKVTNRQEVLIPEPPTSHQLKRIRVVDMFAEDSDSENDDSDNESDKDKDQDKDKSKNGSSDTTGEHLSGVGASGASVDTQAGASTSRDRSTSMTSKATATGSFSGTTGAQELDVRMMDNWDDPEGYYNVILGELFNGRYHVRQLLGRGMFSTVIRAGDSKANGNLVAIKIIRNNDAMRKAATKELEILQTLRDADPDDKCHMIRCERQFNHKGHLCLVFENLNLNLREVLDKFGGRGDVVGINLATIRPYAQQLFMGLNLLRKCKILHADLKPDNLLVNSDRTQVKICDLGSATFISDTTLGSDEGGLAPYLVSRFYRAPEIILGVPYDYAVDVWSIGCTLYELYTGKILFTGRTNNQMLRTIMECRGQIPPKTLRRGALTPMHFDEDLHSFRSVEEDVITGKVATKTLAFKKPIRDLKTRVVQKGGKDTVAPSSSSGSSNRSHMRTSVDEKQEMMLFVDLLERCLALNPEKRCTPEEALKHPFVVNRRLP